MSVRLLLIGSIIIGFNTWFHIGANVSMLGIPGILLFSALVLFGLMWTAHVARRTLLPGRHRHSY